MPEITDQGTSLIPLDRTPAAIKVDNLIRQRLRIGDPRDPVAVAEGLRRLFPKDARLQELEGLGLPTLPTGFTTVASRPAESLATTTELDQATADVERDLRALATDHRLKEIEPELLGWGQAIRSIIADGTAAARLALDPNARDRLFGARRQLGDYARLARFVGALTPALSVSYRKFARSLDLTSSLQLVIAGESLAGAGLGSGRFMLSVPASGLQARRDAVLMALRTLIGTTEQAVGNDQWPWSLQGLQQILERIERSGHLDLRALLDEAVLGRALDELIERGSRQNVTGLRALGATADVTLQRLYRLLDVGGQVEPAMPALTTLLTAIRLFLDAFRGGRRGYRLLFIGRAPISFYGKSPPDNATKRLLELIRSRGALAEVLDCLGCDCSINGTTAQIVLDTVLYSADRAIDLYVLGNDEQEDQGEAEWRAAAYGFFIKIALDVLAQAVDLSIDPQARYAFETALTELCKNLINDFDGEVTDKQRASMIHELCIQQILDQQLVSVLSTLSPGCISLLAPRVELPRQDPRDLPGLPGRHRDLAYPLSILTQVIHDTIAYIKGLPSRQSQEVSSNPSDECPEPAIKSPPPIEALVQRLIDIKEGARPGQAVGASDAAEQLERGRVMLADSQARVEALEAELDQRKTMFDELQKSIDKAASTVDRVPDVSSEREPEQVEREQRAFRDELLDANWLSPRPGFGVADALKIGKKVGLPKPILVCEYLHYWTASSDLDPSWKAIAEEIQGSLGRTALEQMEADFPSDSTVGEHHLSGDMPPTTAPKSAAEPSGSRNPAPENDPSANL